MKSGSREGLPPPAITPPYPRFRVRRFRKNAQVTRTHRESSRDPRDAAPPRRLSGTPPERSLDMPCPIGARVPYLLRFRRLLSGVAPSRDGVSQSRVGRSPGLGRVTFAPYTRRTYTPPRDDAVAVQLGVPVTGASRGLTPPSHFPTRFRSPVDSAGSRRCAPYPATKRNGRPRRASRW